MSDSPRRLIPKGVVSFLPAAAVIRKGLEETILTVFARWGYHPVIPPLFEYLDVISAGLDKGLVEKGYKFVDRGSGRMMILRPDATPQIARMVAMAMADSPTPLRLCYSANVVRHEEEHAGREREIFQIGGELIGQADATADAEVISLAIEALTRVGLKKAKVVIGHVDYFRSLLQSFRLPPAVVPTALDVAAKKESSRLAAVLKKAGLAREAIARCEEALTLVGGEAVLDRAMRLSRNRRSRTAVERVRSVYRILRQWGFGDFLLIDLGEVRGLDYYTGVTFEVFVEGEGLRLGGGGRYDNLLSRFGYDCPSTGLALDMEKIQHAVRDGGLTTVPAQGALLLVGGRSDPSSSYRVASALREKGYCVAMHPPGASRIDGAVTYARSQGIRKIIVLGARGRASASRHVLVINAETGARRSGHLTEVLAQL